METKKPPRYKISGPSGILFGEGKGAPKSHQGKRRSWLFDSLDPKAAKKPACAQCDHRRAGPYLWSSGRGKKACVAALGK